MPQSTALRKRQELTAPDVTAIIDCLRKRGGAGDVLTAIRHFPARQPQWRAMPEWVQPGLLRAYGAKGVAQLYSHQAKAVEDFPGFRKD